MKDCKWLRCVRWEKWQSYRRDRGQPPWIKLHRRLLRNLDWLALSDAQRGQLVGLWMLAADNDGHIPCSAEVVRKLAGLDELPDLKFFQDNGWLENDAKMTPHRRRHVAPEENRIENRTEETVARDLTEEEEEALAEFKARIGA